MIRLLATALFTLLLCSYGQAQYLDGRNNAMGGVGTASSHYLTAGFSNPALLTHASENDNFGFLVPTFGITGADKDGLVSDLNDFVDSVQSVQDKITNATVTAGDLANLSSNLLDLNGKTATANLGAGFAMAMPSETFAWAIHAHSYADVHFIAQIDPADATRIITAVASNQLDSLSSEIRVVGVSITEFGVSMATTFDVGSMRLAVGVTPKFQRIDTINYSANVSAFDDNEFDSDQYTNDETAVNANIGATLQVTDALTMGLMIRDVISNDYLTTGDLGQQFTYQIKPLATLGAAWSNDILTLAIDADLTEAERFKDSNLKFGTPLDDNSRFIRAGFEISAGSWVQLRGGIQTDLENTVDDILTGGVGMGIFDAWRLNIGASYSGTDSYGGIVQMSFTF
jgi:hypothetical protein